MSEDHPLLALARRIELGMAIEDWSALQPMTTTTRDRFWRYYNGNEPTPARAHKAEKSGKIIDGETVPTLVIVPSAQSKRNAVQYLRVVVGLTRHVSHHADCPDSGTSISERCICGERERIIKFEAWQPTPPETPTIVDVEIAPDDVR